MNGSITRFVSIQHIAAGGQAVRGRQVRAAAGTRQSFWER